MKYSFIVPFRNRSLIQVQNHLNSISRFIGKNELIFIDSGSGSEISNELLLLINEYPFVKYHHIDTEGHIWNKSEALNYGIKCSQHDIIIILDIDLVIPIQFLDLIEQYDFNKQFLTFDTYYLAKNQTSINYNESIPPSSFVGLLVAKKDMLFHIGLFDEYYLGWGFEDDDVNVRLEKNNLTRIHITVEKIEIFHFWHESLAPSKPTLWYLTMLNHFMGQKSIINISDSSSVLYVKRPAKSIYLKGLYKKHLELKLVHYRKILIFYQFVRDFSMLSKDSICWFEYSKKIDLTKVPPKWIVSLNKVLNKLPYFDYNLYKKEKYHMENEITFTDIKNFIEYFIGINRKLIFDYYLDINDNSIKLILIKN